MESPASDEPKSSSVTPAAFACCSQRTQRMSQRRIGSFATRSIVSVAIEPSLFVCMTFTRSTPRMSLTRFIWRMLSSISQERPFASVNAFIVFSSLMSRYQPPFPPPSFHVGARVTSVGLQVTLTVSASSSGSERENDVTTKSASSPLPSPSEAKSAIAVLLK